MIEPMVADFRREGLDLVMYDLNKDIFNLYNVHELKYKIAPC